MCRRALSNSRRSDTRRGALGHRLAGNSPRLERDHADDLGDREHVLTALSMLRPGDREALLLIAWDGLTTPEAAKVMRCSSRTFSVRLHRAKGRFAKQLAIAGGTNPMEGTTMQVVEEAP